MPDPKYAGRPYLPGPDRHDELSTGVADSAQGQASQERKAGGKGIAKGSKLVPSLGGQARKGETYLSHNIQSEKLEPIYVRRARTLRNALRSEISASVGGGVCGVATSLLLKFASQKTAAAEQAFKAGDFEAHRKLTESARMDVLYAREHAAKEALARAEVQGKGRRADGRPKPGWIEVT